MCVCLCVVAQTFSPHCNWPASVIHKLRMSLCFPYYLYVHLFAPTLKKAHMVNVTFHGANLRVFYLPLARPVHERDHPHLLQLPSSFLQGRGLHWRPQSNTSTLPTSSEPFLSERLSIVVEVLQGSFCIQPLISHGSFPSHRKNSSRMTFSPPRRRGGNLPCQAQPG